jgi:hypothetical protein
MKVQVEDNMVMIETPSNDYYYIKVRTDDVELTAVKNNKSENNEMLVVNQIEANRIRIKVI